MSDLEISKLVEELRRLLPTAKVHEYSALFPAARTHECHVNADQFASNNEGYRVVRGWLFFDFRSALPFGMAPFVRFSAHSVVEGPDGERYDITPTLASKCYPFIEHPFGNEDFERLIDGRHLSNIDVEM